MNQRIRELRTYLNLNQEVFGKRLGITKTAVSKMELNTYSITETMYKLICIEFNVNEEWLRSGKGDIFYQKSYEDELHESLGNLLVTGTEQTLNILKEISKLEDHESELILQLLKTINKNK